MDDGEIKTVYEAFKIYNFVANDFSLLILYVDAVDGRMSLRNKRTARLLPPTSFGFLDQSTTTTA